MPGLTSQVFKKRKCHQWATELLTNLEMLRYATCLMIFGAVLKNNSACKYWVFIIVGTVKARVKVTSRNLTGLTGYSRLGFQAVQMPRPSMVMLVLYLKVSLRGSQRLA